MDKKALVTVKKFKQRVQKAFPLEVLVFFGSRSVSEHTKESDIDLIIVSKQFQKLNFYKRCAKMYDYWDSRYPVDFICLTPREFQKQKKNSFISTAMEKGTIV